MIHISHQHRAVIVPYRADVQALFPHSVAFDYLGEKVIALPHGTEETRMLRNLNLDVPAPIVEHYDWPGNKRPFDKQILTSALLTLNHRCYVLNKMGTGKTRACIWAFDFLRRQRLVKKMLVVAPLSTLTFTWVREIMQTLGNAKVQVLTGDRARRLKRLGEEADIYIINHDGLGVIEDALVRRNDIDVVCIDEVAVFRNAKARRSKVAQRVCAARPWVWGMTGSPTPTAPTDAYGLAKLITPANAPKSFTQFRQDTMLQINQFKWLPRKDSAEVVSSLLQPSVCYSLDDVTELPPLIERSFEVAMGPRQQKAYDQMKNDAVVMLKSGTVTAQNGGIVLGKMMQIACGWVYNDKKEVEELDNDLRLQALLEAIEGTERKLIVFSPYIHTVRGIAKFLDKEGVDYRTVYGDTNDGDRNEAFNLFQNTTAVKVLNAHPQCMAHGLTLTAADTIVWFSPIPSLEIYEQANARIRRIGQTAKQQVLKFMGCPVERAMYNRLDQRRDVQESVLQLLAEIAEAD
jgi:SNF2 family DNA or RNA helicase